MEFAKVQPRVNDLVYVEWVDHVRCTGEWCDRETVKDQGLLTCHYVGWVLSVHHDRVVIAACMGQDPDDQQVGAVMTLAWGCVASWQKLEVMPTLTMFPNITITGDPAVKPGDMYLLNTSNIVHGDPIDLHGVRGINIDTMHKELDQEIHNAGS